MGRQRASLDLSDFKVCPLCGGLNRVARGECHVCAWGGEFEHNLFAIEFALQSERAHEPMPPSLSMGQRLVKLARMLVARCLGRYDILA